MLDSLFPCSFRFFMAEEEIVVSALTWPGEEPLETESSFTLDGTGEIPFTSIGQTEDWEVVLPSTSGRVFSEYDNYVFPMYEVVFKDMGFQLPFFDFHREVLRWTKLSPSQIHPNFYAFMKAFELVCQYLRIPPLKNFFFTIFTVQRGADWDSFHQTQKNVRDLYGESTKFQRALLFGSNEKRGCFGYSLRGGDGRSS